MRRVDDEIQHHLVDFARETVHERQFGEAGLDFSDVLVFIGRDHQRAGDGLIDVGLRLLLAIGMREFLHGTHDVRHAAKTVARAIERHGRVLEDVVEIGIILGLFGGFGGRLEVGAALHGAAQLTIFVDDRRQVIHGLAHEQHAVRHELHRRVDFVGHARGQPADALEFLRLREIILQPALIGDVEHHAAQHLVLAGAFALLAARHPAQVDALLVLREHRGFDLEIAAAGLVDAMADRAIALARHEPVEEADLLPEIFTEAEPLRTLRPDVFEMPVFEVERERNGLGSFDHQSKLLTPALEFARALGHQSFEALLFGSLHLAALVEHAHDFRHHHAEGMRERQQDGE